MTQDGSVQQDIRQVEKGRVTPFGDAPPLNPFFGDNRGDSGQQAMIRFFSTRIVRFCAISDQMAAPRRGKEPFFREPAR